MKISERMVMKGSLILVNEMQNTFAFLINIPLSNVYWMLITYNLSVFK